MSLRHSQQLYFIQEKPTNMAQHIHVNGTIDGSNKQNIVENLYSIAKSLEKISREIPR